MTKRLRIAGKISRTWMILATPLFPGGH